MRTFLIIALLVCIAVLLGWLSFSDQGDTASINIDKREAQEETEEAVEAVEEAVEDLSDRIERQFDSDDSEADDIKIEVDTSETTVPDAVEIEARPQ